MPLRAKRATTITIVGRAITIKREKKERKYTKKCAMKSNKSNRECFNIAIAILEKLIIR